MSVLLLRLAGPLQSWGDSSKFTTRSTSQIPTKSGVVGLIAAAQGRRRSDPIEDLTGLRFGVRIDQRGRMMRDFQSASDTKSGKTISISDRYYLGDAVFVIGLEGADTLLEAIVAALADPKFPIYLGRRAFPVTGKLVLGIVDQPLRVALSNAEWQAANWYRKRQPPQVSLDLVVDGAGETDGLHQQVQDAPISFDPVRRVYGWRSVTHLDPVVVSNDVGRAESDFFAAVEGA